MWGDVKGLLDRALDLAGTCHQLYGQAPDQIRRQLSQGFFERIYIGHDGEVARVALTDAFSLLLADDLIERIEADRTGAATEQAQRSQGLAVDSTGPEPAKDKRSDLYGPDLYVVKASDVHGSNMKPRWA